MVDGEPQKKYFDVAAPAGKRPAMPELKVEDKKIIEPPEKIVDNQLSGNTTTIPDDEATFKADTLMEPAEANENEVGEVSNAGFTITPVPEKDEQPQPSEDSQEVSSKLNEGSGQVDKFASIGQFEQVPSEQTTESSSEPEPENKDNTKGESVTVKKIPETEESPAADTGPEDSVTGSGGSDNQESVDKDVPMSEEQFASANITEDPGKKAAETAKADMQEPKIYDTKEYYVPIGRAHHKHGGLKGPFVFGIICAIIVVAVALYAMYLLGK
jgi:hypothetical protein